QVVRRLRRYLALKFRTHLWRLPTNGLFDRLLRNLFDCRGCGGSLLRFLYCLLLFLDLRFEGSDALLQLMCRRFVLLLEVLQLLLQILGLRRPTLLSRTWRSPKRRKKTMRDDALL